jgi:hypothetical protein
MHGGRGNMAQLTRAQLVTEICDIVGKKTSASSVSGKALQDRVPTYLNFAQRRMARMASFDELCAIQESAVTVANVQSYPFSTGTNNLGLTRFKDFMTVRLIDSENSRILTRWHYKTMDRKFPDPTTYTTGRPGIYTRWGNNMIVFRIPDDAYDMYIRYSQWPTDLTTDAQTSDFENKDELLIAAGCLETYLALEEVTDAAAWLTRFDALMETARVDDLYEPDWEPEAEPMSSGSGMIHDSPSQISGGLDVKASFEEPGDPLYGYSG